jgi:FkbH-like protein
MRHIVAKIRRSLARDADLPLGMRASKAARYLIGSVAGPRKLRDCDTVGPRPRVVGRMVVRNTGRIDVGADAVLFARYAPVELTAMPGGTLALGDNAHVNYGTMLRAHAAVRIGRNASIGPYCILDDAVVHLEEGRRVERGDPIEIGDGVWLAARVTVLPGTSIGAGSVITAGSIVSGTIPPGVVAGGIPARVLRALDPAARVETPAPRVVSPAKPTASTVPLIERRGRVLADFTIGDLAVRLAEPTEGVVLEVVEAPYAQTTQHLLGPAPSDATDFLVVWTRPEIASDSFASLLAGEPVGAEALASDVDLFCDQLATGASAYRHTFVPTWTLPAWHRGRGMIDLRPGGTAWALAVMNRRLAARFETTPSIYVLDAGHWLAATAASNRSRAKAWYVGKVPFSSAMLGEAARDIKAAVRGLEGQARKLLVLDLDDTLWGGIVGDQGWENLQLGGHDPIGESFVDFQRAVKALTARGIVLGIVSKNTEEVALEAIRSHPEMVLRAEDFVGWRINWRDKAQNIVDLARELNLGLQSVVFIDDNPVERARVAEALPEVFVPDWPADKLRYVEELGSLRCFDTPAISAEDAARTSLYALERERSAAREQVGSLDDWLTSLGVRVHVEPLRGATLARTQQLLNKTNQMNLSTRRLTEHELDAWHRAPGHEVLAVTVSDRFGSAGLTGILSLELAADRCDIVDFVLSCRVMGRRVEETMLHVAVEWARERGAASVSALCQPTKKNKPCQDFFRASGWTVSDDEKRFTWLASAPYSLPAPIALDWNDASDGALAAR